MRSPLGTVSTTTIPESSLSSLGGNLNDFRPGDLTRLPAASDPTPGGTQALTQTYSGPTTAAQIPPTVTQYSQYFAENGGAAAENYSLVGVYRLEYPDNRNYMIVAQIQYQGRPFYLGYIPRSAGEPDHRGYVLIDATTLTGAAYQRKGATDCWHQFQITWRPTADRIRYQAYHVGDAPPPPGGKCTASVSQFSGQYARVSNNAQ